MIVPSTRFVSIALFVQQNPRRPHVVRVVADIAKVQEKERSGFEQVLFKMRPLTWKLQNDILEEATTYNKRTRMGQVDWQVFKERKLMRCLVAWGIKNKKGDPLPITAETIMRLPPTLAETLLHEYDLVEYLDDVNRKRLALAVDSYIKSSRKGMSTISPPRELIEAGLFEMFHWSPDAVDRISYKRLQRLFVVLNQRDASQESAQEYERFKSELARNPARRH